MTGYLRLMERPRFVFPRWFFPVIAGATVLMVVSGVTLLLTGRKGFAVFMFVCAISEIVAFASLWRLRLTKHG